MLCYMYEILVKLLKVVGAEWSLKIYSTLIFAKEQYNLKRCDIKKL